MLNFIWPIFIIVSFTYAIFAGNLEELNASIFESTESVIQLCITLLGTISLWNGIMQIANESSILEKLTRVMSPIVKLLFPEMKDNKQIQKEISMNMIANILGLGNAATPLGMKAMQSMQKENDKKDTLSNSMAMFIVINTASIQLIPTTVIAIRTSLGSENPTSIVFPVWIATMSAAIVAIVATKICIHLSKRGNL